MDAYTSQLLDNCFISSFDDVSNVFDDVLVGVGCWCGVLVTFHTLLPVDVFDVWDQQVGFMWLSGQC